MAFEIEAAFERVRQALEAVSLRPFRRDPTLQRLVHTYEQGHDRTALLRDLDAWLVDNELYREVTPPTVLEQIAREDLQLVCWEAVGM